jgi:hypothetical protein
MSCSYAISLEHAHMHPHAHIHTYTYRNRRNEHAYKHTQHGTALTYLDVKSTSDGAAGPAFTGSTSCFPCVAPSNASKERECGKTSPETCSLTSLSTAPGNGVGGGSWVSACAAACAIRTTEWRHVLQSIRSNQCANTKHREWVDGENDYYTLRCAAHHIY